MPYSVAESADELRYRKSLLQTEQALLNASKNELKNITSEDIKHTLEQINGSIADLDTKVKNAVDKLLQYEIECFTSVNASACDMIINGHTAFKLILDKIAEHFEQASYLQSLLNSREESIDVIERKLQTSATQINILNSKIKAAELLQIEKDIDLSSNNNIETRSCPEAGKIHFTFDTKHTTIDSYACSDASDSQNKEEEKLPYCHDERIPVNVSQHMLWNVASCSVDHQLRAFGLYDNFTRLMNSAPAVLTASLSKVDIHRPWFDKTIFSDWEHFTMVSAKLMHDIPYLELLYSSWTTVYSYCVVYHVIQHRCKVYVLSFMCLSYSTEKRKGSGFTRTTGTGKILPGSGQKWPLSHAAIHFLFYPC